MIPNARLLFCALLLLITACKDTPASPQVEAPAVDTTTTVKKPKRSKRDLARMYGVTITRSGDTLLPLVVQDSVISFFTEYGKKNPENRVRMKTTYGTIDIELFKETPIERASFIFLIKNNFFSHSVVYRVVPNFVVQAGNSDDRLTAMKRSSAGDYQLPPHFISSLKHTRGTVSLAKQWDDNPQDWHSPFEFFISLGTARHLDGKHTIFGRVTSGMDVADAISKLKTDTGDWPIEYVAIEMSVVD